MDNKRRDFKAPETLDKQKKRKQRELLSKELGN